MGRLAQLSDRKAFPGQDQARSAWREIFQSTHKEQVHSQPKQSIISGPGNAGWANSSTTVASYMRLLQAMRSMAPGGWSDNRWEQTKHFVGIQYVAIHRCGEQMSQAEFQVFQKDDNAPDGKIPVKRGHPGYKLVDLLEKPNPDDSFGDLMYSWNQQLDLTGMALTWMVPNKLGVPMEVYPIPTAIAIPQPAINPEYPDGFYRIQPVYPYGPFSSYPTPASAVGAPIPAQWMLRFKYIHPLLRYEGYSPQTAMQLHIDEVESIDRSRWYAMKRGVNPSAVLNMENVEEAQPIPGEEIERIKAEFEASLQGPENAGQLHVAYPGAKLEQWGNRPLDMDYQQGWEQLVSFVMGSFGITKPAAGMIEDSSYSTLFATLKQLYWLTLEPKCNRIAAKLTRHLAPHFGDDLIVEIRCKRIDDHEVKQNVLRLAMDGKAITKNELRKELEMPLTKEEWGADMAGDPSQAEQQMEQEKQKAMMEAKKVQGEGAGSDMREEAEETTKSRPRPGHLGAGSLGPRSTLEKKSLYHQLRKSLANGNGYHPK